MKIKTVVERYNGFLLPSPFMVSVFS